MARLLWGSQGAQVGDQNSWGVLNSVPKLISKAAGKLRKRYVQSSRSDQGTQALESFIFYFFFLVWLLQYQVRCYVIA